MKSSGTLPPAADSTTRSTVTLPVGCAGESTVSVVSFTIARLVPGVPSKVARDVYDRLHKTAGPREGAAPVAGGAATGGEDAWS